MREISAVGSVTWDGNCRNGLISGNGVLREEGVVVEGGRRKRFAYYLSGNAQKGLRKGRWTRDTLDRFVDSPKSWISLASLEFVDGIGKGAPKPIPLRGADQHSESFRTRILGQNLQMARVMEPPPAPVAAPSPVAVVAGRAAVTLTTEAPEFVAGQTFAFGTACYMDTLDGRLWEGRALTVKDRQTIEIHGWSVDGESKLVPDATYLRLEGPAGRRFYAPTIQEDRPDVGQHFGEPALAKSGYRVVVSAGNLPPGEYEATILMNAGGRNVLCGNGRKLRL